MRVLESLLALEVLACLVIMILGGFPPAGVSLAAACIAATAAVHALAEQARWQLLPVYVLAVGLTFGMALGLQVEMPWLQYLLLSAGILLVLLSLGLAWLIPVFSLPPPKGPYSIAAGYLSFHDPHRANRLIQVKIWVPTRTPDRPKRLPYHPQPAKALKGIMNFPGFVFSHLKLVKTAAHSDISLSEKEKFPVLLYSHGAMSSYVDNTALLEELASQGYAVVSIDHDFSFEAYDIDVDQARSMDPDQQKTLIQQLIDRAAPAQSLDQLFVLQSLAKRDAPYAKMLNLDLIGLLGHSLGGTTALHTAAGSAACKAVINMDGPVANNIPDDWDTPFLYLSSFSPDLPDEELKKRRVPANFYRKVKNHELAAVKSLFEGDHHRRHWLRMESAGHLDLTDFPFMVPMMKTPGYQAAPGHEMKANVIREFFDAYLKGSGTFSPEIQPPLLTLNAHKE